MARFIWILFVFYLVNALAIPLENIQDFIDEMEDKAMHKLLQTKLDPSKERYADAERDSLYWEKLAKDRVRELIKNQPNLNKAKNVIFFLGDGMSLSTVSAARAYMGQMNGKPGEETELSFEKFPTSGLSKTYCIDRQTADSACSATAYLGGVKANFGTIGVNDDGQMTNTSNHVHSIAKLFTDNGRSAGIVTTTRVTHASPAAAYAHTSARDWETDTNVLRANADPLKCRDIAHQLIHGDPGKHFKVILGGGRRQFRNSTVSDENGDKGSRSDGRDLIEEWKTQKSENKLKHKYVWNKSQLNDALNESTDCLLGLFNSDHNPFHMASDNAVTPSFEEMVEAAIKTLSKDSNGYFLFAEGGRIDHAHHVTLAQLALDETVEFSKGIAKAASMTDPKDTLIIVTSDHSHVMTYSGYAPRGNSILRTAGEASDGLEYMTLSYANGPGYRKEVNGERVDVASEDTSLPQWYFPAMVPLDIETHGGDDVGIYASGPWNHLFSGVHEQSYIPHIIKYATCLDSDLSACRA